MRRRRVSEAVEKKEVTIAPVDGDKSKMATAMDFQVAGVNKPLASVAKICAKGNIVHFGAKKDDNYIMNIESGNKFFLTPDGKRSYLMEVKLLGG